MPTQKDPTTFGYQNFFSTTLTGDITSGTLTIGLATVPTPTSGILVIEPDSTSAREVVFYTSKGASTVTCPSDGRGWSGSTAAAHLQGSTVIMATVDEYFEGLADGTLSADPLRTALASNFVVSGGVVAQSAGLVGTFSNIVFYLNGQRYSGSSIANKTYTASKDTYVDVTAASGGAVSVTYTEVANGAASPALAANYLRIAKVTTSGAAITSVVQYSTDSLGNTIYPDAPVGKTNIQFPDFSSVEVATGEIWVDGRPVYRKVLRGQVSLVSGTATISHGISGLTTAWELLRCSGGTKYSAASNNGGQIILHAHREAAGNWNHIDSVTQTDIQWVGSFAWGSSYYMIILEYVK